MVGSTIIIKTLTYIPNWDVHLYKLCKLCRDSCLFTHSHRAKQIFVLRCFGSRLAAFCWSGDKHRLPPRGEGGRCLCLCSKDPLCSEGSNETRKKISVDTVATGRHNKGHCLAIVSFFFSRRWTLPATASQELCLLSLLGIWGVWVGGDCWSKSGALWPHDGWYHLRGSQQCWEQTAAAVQHCVHSPAVSSW